MRGPQSRAIGSIVHNENGSLTVWMAPLITVTLTPEQARAWAQLFVGGAEAAEALWNERQRRTYAAITASSKPLFGQRADA